ncbi:MAG: hypothetical protein KDA87_12860 [Planctomycetales bacterium]|nr:hypothetical protein [Planctomycetales bacterium]
MKALVACPLHLLEVDLDTHAVRRVESHRPEYYGVSWSHAGDRLILSHSGLNNEKMASLESYMDSEVGFLSTNGVAGAIGLSQPHQIVCTEQHVIATNTGRNSLTVFRQDDGFYKNIWIEDAKWDRKGKENCCGSHLNSVFLKDDQLFVLAHNFDRGSDVIILSWPDLQLIKRWKTKSLQAHNVWVTATDQVLVCDTMRGTLLDAVSNKVLWSCDEPTAMTRGLACDGKYVYIGRSEQSDRRGRTESDGGIWIVDRKSWKTQDYIHLPGVGNVMEVRLLDVPDECHHQRPFTGKYDTTPLQLGQTNASVVHRCEVDATQADWSEHLAPMTLRSDAMLIAPQSALATKRRLCLADVSVSAKVDVTDANARHAGVVARYRGPGETNMLNAMLHKEGPYVAVELWLHHAGKWERLGIQPANTLQGELTLVCCGENVKVLFDGNTLIEAQCQALGNGSVGIRTSGGAVGSFQCQDLTIPQRGKSDIFRRLGIPHATFRRFA